MANSIRQSYNLFKNFASKFYAECGIYETPALTDLQKKKIEELALLAKLDAGNQFSFVMNMLSKKGPELIHCSGVQECIGYNNFTVLDYFSIIPDKHLMNLVAFAKLSFEVARQGKIDFTTKKYSVLIPIKMANGSYFLVKRTLQPFVTSGTIVISYINSFHLINEMTEHEYQNFPLQPTVTNLIHQRDFSLENELVKNQEVNFTKKEWNILNAYFLDANHTAKTIALSFGIRQNTVESHHFNIMKKFKEQFGMIKSVPNVKELAFWLDENKLLKKAL